MARLTDDDEGVGLIIEVDDRLIGFMRRYERANDGTWRDSLLMDLQAEELVWPAPE